MSNIALTATVPHLVSSRRSLGRRIPLVVWNILLLAAVITLGALYLVRVNTTMAYGYEIRDAERRLNELRSEVRLNQVKLSEIEAVGNLTAQAQSLGMVPVGQVEYIAGPNMGVARR